jgi:Fanconi-associated nuclease 1
MPLKLLRTYVGSCSTQLPDKILTPSLLACVKKRFYPSYTFTRTSDIWKTRDDLLNFEKALELEAKLSEYLDTSGGITGSRRGKSVAKAPTPRMDQQTKVSHAHARTEDIFQTTTSDGHDTTAVTPGPDDGKRGENSVSVEEDLVVSPRVRDAMSIKAVFESVYEVWKALLSENADNVDADKVEQEARRRRGLRRYECGTSCQFHPTRLRLSDCAVDQAMSTPESCTRERRLWES